MHTPRLSRRRFLQSSSAVFTACAGGLLPTLGLLPSARAGTLPGDYRALVCLYLSGGNDSWNLLIPGDPTEHARYVQARSGLYGLSVQTGSSPNGLAIPHWSGTGFVNGQTLPTSLPIAGNQFALNPFCSELQTLFGENKLAFLANIGPLVHPSTAATYTARGRPPQLYSHNDQTNLWHIGSGSSSNVRVGWGGQVAGRVALPATSTAGLPPSITLAGQNRFLIGETAGGMPITPFALSTSQTTPATSIANYNPNSTASNQFQAERRQYLDELLASSSDPLFAEEYRAILSRALGLAEDVINPSMAPQSASIPGGIPASDPVNGGGATGFTWPTDSLGQQLQQVARMIRIAASRPDQPGYVSPINANRQVFFVNLGGFDSHDGQITSLTATDHHLLLQRVSQAVFAFQRAMAAIGRDNDVTLFSASEFARTLNSNGNGSDHAWGGVQFVVGGAVNGGAVFGRYPTIALDNQIGDSGSINATAGETFSRGQFIPTLAVDQLGATLARWMGVTDGELDLIFPNLANFSSGPYASVGATPSFAYFNRIVPGLMAGVA